MVLPAFWKSNLKDIDDIVSSVKKGRVTTTYSPGKRPIYLVEYGTPNDYSYRTANFNSAAGAHDITCYRDKSREGTKPCVFLVGAMHGAEFEGTVAMLNLISIIETGLDLAGDRYPEFEGIEDKMHLLLVPCANPDGRARVPVDAFGETSAEEFRKWAQGTWKKDGTLANWPGCKKVHPIKEASDFLGSYFDDNGVNLMHDDFFNPMAEETKLVFHLATKYAPDLIAGLHGAAEMGYGIYHPGCATYEDLEEGLAFEKALKETFEGKGIRYIETHCDNSVREFNQTVALYYACGALSVTWESYQGVLAREDELMDVTVYDQILDAHFLFFDECFKHVINKFAGE